VVRVDAFVPEELVSRLHDRDDDSDSDERDGGLAIDRETGNTANHIDHDVLDGVHLSADCDHGGGEGRRTDSAYESSYWG